MAVARALAAAPIQPLVWKLPDAAGVAIKRKKKRKTKTNKQTKKLKQQQKRVLNFISQQENAD